MILSHKLVAIFATASTITAYAVTALPYNSVDALRGLAPGGHGVDQAAKFIGATHLALASMQPTKSAEDLYLFANDSIKDIAFERFLTSPSGMEAPDHSRSYTFTGTQLGEHFIVDVPKVNLGSTPFRNFFDMGLQIAIKDNAPRTDAYARGFGIRAQGRMMLDEISHHSFLQLIGNQLRVMDPGNLMALQAPPSPLFKSVQDVAARKIINDLVASYPRVAAMLDQFETLDTRLEQKTQDGRPYLHVTVHSKLNLAALAKAYPDLGAFLQRLTGHITIKTASDYLLTNSQSAGGLRLLSIGNNTEDQTVDFSFNTVSGGLLPDDQNHQVHFDALVVPSAIAQQEASLNTALHLDAYGLAVEVAAITTSVHYIDGLLARGTAKIAAVSPPKFEGALLGFLPPNFIDAFIPGSLEAYAQTLIQCLLTANANEGTFLTVVIDSRQPEKTHSEFSAGTELADNFFLRLGLRLANDYLWPDAATLNDARSFLAASSGRLNDDIAAIKSHKDL